MKCGLLGEKLGHSYSPSIHRFFGDYEYRLIELSREKVSDFIKNGEWDALNVTIPYKKDVFTLCDEVTPQAASIGSVNTIVRRNGKIYGDNTDLYGFGQTLHQFAEVVGKKVLVLGSGGASVSVSAVLREKHANVVTISRSGRDNYENLDRHADAAMIVNATPVGMFPNNGVSPVDLTRFPKCKAVIDLIYNPAKTVLLLQASDLQIPCRNGLNMLVAQAKRSAEIFLDREISDQRITEIETVLSAKMRNLILIGMPGCGKSTVGRLLSETLGRPMIDTDEIFSTKYGTPAEYIRNHGEAAFRSLEHTVIAGVGKASGAVISTGGGCVMNSENLNALRQNGLIIRLCRDPEKLARDGRPLSVGNLNMLAKMREPFYNRFADLCVDNNGTPSDAVHKIMEATK